MDRELLDAIESSQSDRATREFNEYLEGGADAWQIHLSLFPVVQRVLNPPFINPHLPKVYRINRELASYLREDEIASLVQLEIEEYARRPKQESLPRPASVPGSVDFGDIESTIDQRDWKNTASIMSAFHAEKGAVEFARRLLLLGSGYLDHSLGHSISCTAFMLLELIERPDQDPWFAIAALADYFCKGRFSRTPRLQKLNRSEDLDQQVLRATSGEGIVNLHHTITLYAVERTKHLFEELEIQHLIASWIRFLGEKVKEPFQLQSTQVEEPSDYPLFFEMFSSLDVGAFLSSVAGMLGSEQGRQRLGRYLIRGLCDRYQGDYDPHYLTGLGSALWLIDRYRASPPIVISGLSQYIDYFFSGVE